MHSGETRLVAAIPETADDFLLALGEPQRRASGPPRHSHPKHGSRRYLLFDAVWTRLYEDEIRSAAVGYAEVVERRKSFPVYGRIACDGLQSNATGRTFASASTSIAAIMRFPAAEACPSKGKT